MSRASYDLPAVVAGEPFSRSVVLTADGASKTGSQQGGSERAMYDRVYVTVVGTAGRFEMDLGRHETLAVVLDRARLALFGTAADSFVVTHDDTALPDPARTLAELADESGWGRQVEPRMLRAETWSLPG